MIIALQFHEKIADQPLSQTIPKYGPDSISHSGSLPVSDPVGEL